LGTLPIDSNRQTEIFIVLEFSENISGNITANGNLKKLSCVSVSITNLVNVLGMFYSIIYTMNTKQNENYPKNYVQYLKC
jgi:hypothetical protein